MAPTADPASVPGLPESTLPSGQLVALPQDVPAAPWECRARALIWWQTGTAPPFDWAGRPTRLATVAFVDYLDTPVGAYREILAGSLIRAGLKPVTQVPFIAVDSLASVAGGRVNWALPKTMADVEVDLASASARAWGNGWSLAVRPASGAAAVGASWAGGSTGVERRLWIPLRIRCPATGPLGTYSTSLAARGRFLRVHTQVEGETLAGWLGSGTHPAVLLSGQLRVAAPCPR